MKWFQKVSMWKKLPRNFWTHFLLQDAPINEMFHPTCHIDYVSPHLPYWLVLSNGKWAKVMYDFLDKVVKSLKSPYLFSLSLLSFACWLDANDPQKPLNRESVSLNDWVQQSFSTTADMFRLIIVGRLPTSANVICVYPIN